MNGNNDKNRPAVENYSRVPQGRPLEAPTPKQMLERSHSRFRKRKKVSVNPGIVIFALIIVAVVAVSVFALVNGSGDKSITALPETRASFETEEAEEEISSEVEVPSAQVHSGQLILVNYQYAYEFPEGDQDIVRVSENCDGLLKVDSTTDSLDPVALENLVSFASDFEERTGDRFFKVNSAHRTYGEQVSIYQNYTETFGEDYARTYVSNPGYSEHHTGMAVDLDVSFDDGSSVPIGEYQYYGIMREMIPSYGFILRYPENKVSLTGIGNEPWHFRYIGVPHSGIVEKSGMCLEEYIDFLKKYTVDGSVIFITYEGVVRTLPYEDSAEVCDCYLIYYVPSEDGETTSVPVPKNADEFRISGNNVDGFIVTVTVGDVPETVSSIDGSLVETTDDSDSTGD